MIRYVKQHVQLRRRLIKQVNIGIHIVCVPVLLVTGFLLVSIFDSPLV